MPIVLVIEDEVAIRDIIYDILTTQNFTVLVASNGQEGIAIAREKLPDLILCDVGLPMVNGYGVLKELRQNASTVAIPFIFLTAFGSESDMRQGMESGADDYLVKPFSAKSLLKAINTRLHKTAQVKAYYEASLDRLRHNITVALPHEFRTPLVGILGASEFLLSDLENLDQEMIRGLILDIHASGDRLHRLIQKYLCFVRLQDRYLKKISPVKDQAIDNACPLIIMDTGTNVLKNFQRHNDLNLAVNVDKLILNGGDCRILFEEIFENAAQFSEAGTPISLLVEERGAQSHIILKDQGRGMTETELSQIGALRQFQRDQYEQQGTGLGLAITKLIIEIYGGDLNIHSQFGKGTTLEIILPQTLP